MRKNCNLKLGKIGSREKLETAANFATEVKCTILANTTTSQVVTNKETQNYQNQPQLKNTQSSKMQFIVATGMEERIKEKTRFRHVPYSLCLLYSHVQ